VRRPEFVILTVRSMKLHVSDRAVNSHSRPCHCCMVCWNEFQRVVFCLGHGWGAQMPNTSSMKRL